MTPDSSKVAEDNETLKISFDASEIHNWSATSDAPSRLPQLVRLLVMDTLLEPPIEIRMPSGSSVNRGGWDGLLNVVRGNAWIPNGVSAWEFSCRERVTGKANEDYEKRSADPVGLDMSETTFVFLTSRRWADKLQWVDKRREEGLWLDVRAFDADDLVLWLERSDEVSRWFANEIGKLPFGYEALERIEERQIETKSNLLAGVTDLKSEIRSLAGSLVAQSEQIDPTTSPDPAYENLATQIDSARDLVRQGLIVAARSKLEEIQDGTADIPDDLKFRIVTNLAACALGDNRIDDACDLFEQAYGIQPGTAAAAANAAVAAELLQDHERALELVEIARSADPRDSNATATLIRVLWEMGQVEQIDDLVASEEWIAQDAKTAFALAGVRLQQERFEEASSLYRSLIAVESEDADVHLALSQSLLNYTLAVGGYGEEWLARLREAKGEAERAAQILQHTQLRGRYLEARVVSAAASAQLGDTDDALGELDAVLREEPDHSAAAFNKGIFLLKEGRPAEARAALEIVQDLERQFDVIVPLQMRVWNLGIQVLRLVC